MPFAGALLAERVASNALASSSSVRVLDRRPRPHARHLSITTRRRIASLSQFTRPLRPAAAYAENNGADSGLCTLAPADYSFYQRMRPVEVTELFLWEHRLLPALGYLPPDEVQRVREALSLAFDAHAGQARRSGEPFITHPVEVARILAELRMDHECLVAGLLHDTVEDCGDAVGLEEIGFHFGPAVKRIVEGETKFSKLPTHHPEREAAAAAAAVDSGTPAAPAAEEKAQDLQFLFLAMTEEVRIIVVKLADRLHNMRTMGSMPPGKQRRIAQETLTVFAPLARLLGLYTLKEELEELSFKYAMPQQYAVVRKAVQRLWDAQRGTVDAAAAQLRARLEGDDFLAGRVRGVRVEGACKALYGTWRKLQESGRSVRDVSEISQLRVVLDPRPPAGPSPGSTNGAAPRLHGDASASERQLCYHVMGLVHLHWAPVPGSIKDYLATPKPNNYQSLHTSVVPTGLSTAALDAGASNGNGNGAYSSNGNGNGGFGFDGAAPRGRSAKPGPGLFPIEIQIRTEAMERLALYGIAVESWSCADYPQGPLPERQLRLGGGDLDPGSGGAARRGVPFPYGVVPGLASLGSSTDEDLAAQLAGERSTSGSGSGSDDARSNGNGATRNGSSSNGNGASAALSNGSGATANGSANGAAASAPGGRLDPQTMSRRINWLNSIRQWQAEFVGTLTASEFVACITDDLLGQGVFVFTPSGQVMRLPKGATAVDFAYHIHTDVGNTMVAARVNGKVVGVDHELANAEVVEVITYKGPVNAAIIKRHQRWLEAARTKTARHKIAKFLREHAALAAAHGLGAPPGSALDGPQAVWLLVRCDDRQGLLADIANVIARHAHNIRSYSGSTDRDAGLFVMEYELEGQPDALGALCADLSGVDSVQGWATGCAMPSTLDMDRRQRRYQ